MEGKEYRVVTNPSDSGVSISHPDKETDDLYLGAYESIIVDPEVWNDDVGGFYRFRERGLIQVKTTTERPRPVPPPPSDEDMPDRPVHASAVRQIVFTSDEDWANSYIFMEPRTGEDGGGDIDVAYLKGMLVPVLKAAENWLERWHLDNRKTRLRSVRKRIKEIQALP